MDFSRHHRNEEGLTTLFVVMLMIVISGVIVIIVENSTRQTDSSKQFTQRMEGGESAESASRTIQNAFTSGFVDANSNNYDITATELAEAVASEDGSVLSPASLSAYTDYPGAPIVQVPGSSPEAPATLWQIVGLIPPSPTGGPNADNTPGNPNLIIFVRSWKQIVDSSTTQTQRNSSATRPQYRRIEMRQGSLADYQILSDAPIQLESNILIEGRIHTNGFSDRVQRPPGAFPTARIWQRGYSESSPGIPATSLPKIRCAFVSGIIGQGVAPLLSTGTGDIKARFNDTDPCNVSANTNEFVDLSKASSTLERLGPSCPGTAIAGVTYHCAGSSGSGVTGASSPYTGGFVYYVNLSSLPSMGSLYKSTHVFDGDVNVSGTAKNGRVSIVTVKPAGSIAPPDITITGNIRHGSRSAVPASSVALISAGNIIVDPAACNPPPISSLTVEAAMVAPQGAVTIPNKFSSQIRPEGTLAQCYWLHISGSITSHLPMTLQYTWGSEWAGFAVRTVGWDKTLSSYAPPYYPVSDPWEIVDARNANLDCAASGTWRTTC